MQVLVERVASIHLLGRHAELLPHPADLREENGVRLEVLCLLFGHALRGDQGRVDVVRVGHELPEGVLHAEVLGSGHGLVVLPAVVLQVSLQAQEVVHDRGHPVLCRSLLGDLLSLRPRRLRGAALVALPGLGEVVGAARAARPLRRLLLLLGLGLLFRRLLLIRRLVLRRRVRLLALLRLRLGLRLGLLGDLCLGLLLGSTGHYSRRPAVAAHSTRGSEHDTSGGQARDHSHRGHTGGTSRGPGRRDSDRGQARAAQRAAKLAHATGRGLRGEAGPREAGQGRRGHAQAQGSGQQRARRAARCIRGRRHSSSLF
mmetsp:Transcript_63364/g.185893  ORF Transcript_63364/g.185893 Transcript_63364/m.185893 type:complete len:315 (-) Transcript_63364:49-993(-)